MLNTVYFAGTCLRLYRWEMVCSLIAFSWQMVEPELELEVDGIRCKSSMQMSMKFTVIVLASDVNLSVG